MDAVHRLRSITPDDEDFADLKPLGDAVRDARVVLIGEQGHGDGATLSARGRIIKYLHRELGFDALAVEAGFYSCAKAEAALAAGEPPMTALRAGLHDVWLTTEVAPLADYIAGTYRAGQPLRVLGFDCQFSSLATLDQVADDIARWFSGSVSAAERDALLALARMSIPFNRQLDPGERQRTRDLLHRLRRQFAAADAFIDQVLWNFIANDEFTYQINRWVRELRAGGAPDHTGERAQADRAYKVLFGIRDRLQAANLAWWLDQLPPQSRVVGWLANGHALRDTWALNAEPPIFEGLETMGRVVSERLGEALYILAATAHHGRGTLCTGLGPLPPAQPGSIEELLAASSAAPAAFVDLRTLPADHELRQPRPSRIWGNMDVCGDWSRTCDGILYIDEMHPSHPAAV